MTFKRFIYVVSFYCLMVTGCRAEEGPYIGRHYTEPDVAIQSACIVYRDQQSGLLVPIVAGQRPVVGTSIAISFEIVVVSGSDAKSAEWALLDEDGNELARHEVRFARNRDAGPGRRHRRVRVVTAWQQAEQQQTRYVLLRRVNGFEDWNTKNNLAMIQWSVANPWQTPQVVP